MSSACKSLAWSPLLIAVLMTGLRTGAQSVTTSQYDNARSGANRFETILTPGSRFPAICGTPTVSANGSRDGVLWVLHSRAWNADDTNAVLFAFDALDTTRLLYVSEQNPSRDRAGLALRFNIPTVANGQVYVGARHEVDVYGLLSRDHPPK